MTFRDFFYLFIEQLFLIFNQMLSIRAFGRRAFCTEQISIYKLMLLSFSGILHGHSGIKGSSPLSKSIVISHLFFHVFSQFCS